VSAGFAKKVASAAVFGWLVMVLLIRGSWWAFRLMPSDDARWFSLVVSVCVGMVAGVVALIAESEKGGR